MASERAVSAGHFVLFGLGAYFIAVLLNSLLKNWLNVNLSTLTGA